MRLNQSIDKAKDNKQKSKTFPTDLQGLLQENVPAVNLSDMIALNAIKRRVNRIISEFVQRDKYKHLFLNSIANSEKFKALSVMGAKPKIPKRKRITHSEKLLHQFDVIWETKKQRELNRSPPTKGHIYPLEVQQTMT